MSFPEKRTLTRNVTTLWTVLISFGLAVFGLWLASLDMSNPPLWWERVVNTIGSTLFAVGLVSLAYELVLRRHVHRELLALIGMQGSLLESRIISAGKWTEVNWGVILRDRKEYAFLLLRPLPWVESNWHFLADAFQAQKCTCRFYVPDPEQDYIPAAATLLDVPELDYKAELRRAATMIEERWKLGLREHRFKKGAIEVRVLDRMPTYNIIVADRMAAISFASSVGQVGDDADYVVVYEAKSDDYPVSWFRTQLLTRKPGERIYSDGEM